MAKSKKVIFTTLAALGIIGAIAYFMRQAKLLKEICVSSTDFNWISNITSIIEL